MESMVQKRQIRKYFFIRYSDPEPHLRVRVQAIQRDDVPQTFGLFMEWFDELRQRGLLSNIVIDTYQRETERYGGPELIGKAEEYFFHDSRTVLNILRKRQVEKLELNPDYIGISFLLAYPWMRLKTTSTGRPDRTNFARNTRRIGNGIWLPQIWRIAGRRSEALWSIPMYMIV